jgi:hypothetical protein
LALLTMHLPVRKPDFTKRNGTALDTGRRTI